MPCMVVEFSLLLKLRDFDRSRHASCLTPVFRLTPTPLPIKHINAQFFVELLHYDSLPQLSQSYHHPVITIASLYIISYYMLGM